MRRRKEPKKGQGRGNGSGKGGRAGRRWVVPPESERELWEVLPIDACRNSPATSSPDRRRKPAEC